MRNFNENNITESVVDRLEAARNPRVRQISEALVRHMHSFVREIEPSQREWEQAIEFLTQCGHMCNEVRQEFILLSDALGVSMLVDAINHRLARGATETTVLGPFYVAAAPEVSSGAHISTPEEGPQMLIEGSVKDVQGKPLVGATVDIWHADAHGFYDVQKEGHPLSSRARVRTNEHGHFHVFGAVPAHYPIPNDGPVGKMLNAQGRHPYRPAHVHFMVAAPGCETLVTHLFLADSEYLDSDVVFGVKDSLVEQVLEVPAGATPYGAHLERPMPGLRRDFVLAPELVSAHGIKSINDLQGR